MNRQVFPSRRFHCTAGVESTARPSRKPGGGETRALGAWELRDAPGDRRPVPSAQSPCVRREVGATCRESGDHCLPTDRHDGRPQGPPRASIRCAGCRAEARARDRRSPRATRQAGASCSRPWRCLVAVRHLPSLTPAVQQTSSRGAVQRLGGGEGLPAPRSPPRKASLCPDPRGRPARDAASGGAPGHESKRPREHRGRAMGTLEHPRGFRRADPPPRKGGRALSGPDCCQAPSTLRHRLFSPRRAERRGKRPLHRWRGKVRREVG